MFMKEQRVAEHVLIAFQGMATSVLGKTIDLKEIGKFIKSALEQTDDIESTKIACGVLADLSNNNNP